MGTKVAVKHQTSINKRIRHEQQQNIQYYRYVITDLITNTVVLQRERLPSYIRPNFGIPDVREKVSFAVNYSMYEDVIIAHCIPSSSTRPERRFSIRSHRLFFARWRLQTDKVVQEKIFSFWIRNILPDIFTECSFNSGCAPPWSSW